MTCEKSRNSRDPPPQRVQSDPRWEESKKFQKPTKQKQRPRYPHKKRVQGPMSTTP